MTCRALIDRRLAVARLGCAGKLTDDCRSTRDAINIVALPLAQRAETLVREVAQAETRTRRLLTLVESLVFRRKQGTRP